MREGQFRITKKFTGLSAAYGRRTWSLSTNRVLLVSFCCRIPGTKRQIRVAQLIEISMISKKPHLAEIIYILIIALRSNKMKL